MGKARQDRIRVPEGWWGALVDFCHQKWKTKTHEEVRQITKLARRTVNRVKRTNEFTAVMFDSLVAETGCETRDQLLRILAMGSTNSDATTLTQPIPADLQARLDAGDELHRAGKYSEAQVVFEEVIARAEQAGSPLAVLKARIDLADAIIRDDRYIERARSALETCERQLANAPDDALLANVCCLQADVEMKIGRISEARSLYRQAQELAAKRKDRFSEARFLIGVAGAERMLGNLAEAHTVLDSAIELYRIEYRVSVGPLKERAATNLGGCYANKAQLHRHQAQLRDALRCLNESENLLRAANDQPNLAGTLFHKAEAFFADSRWQDGFDVLNEAFEIFDKIGSTRWVVRCFLLRARLAATHQQQGEAYRYALEAVNKAHDAALFDDYIEALLTLAATCRHFRAASEAERLVLEAKTFAQSHQLTEEYVDCLDAEVEGLYASSETVRAEPVAREAIAVLQSLASTCEIKGRRAYFLKRMGRFCGLLREFQEARQHLSEALDLFEEIGDAGGTASCLGMLAATARESGDRREAIAILTQLLPRAEGKPLRHFRAMATHDLAALYLTERDLTSARKNLDACLALCSIEAMSDVKEAADETERRLEELERSRRPPHRDLATMLRDLHMWLAQCPNSSHAVLSFWYRAFGAELLANCRSLFGVRFMVRTESLPLFENFARDYTDLGDLFIYTPSTYLRAEKAIDLIPLFDDTPFPSHVPFGGFKKEQKLTPKQMAVATIRALETQPYYGTLMNHPEYPRAKVCIISRRYRVADDVAALMLGKDADTLLARRTIAFPVGQDEEKQSSLLKDLAFAHEHGLLPVYFESLPGAEQVELQLAANVSFKVQRGNDHSETDATTRKEGLRRFVLEAESQPRVALANLVDFFNRIPLVAAPRASVSARVCVFRFRVRDADVFHPALIASPSERPNAGARRQR